MRTFLKLSFVFTLLLALASCKGPDKGEKANTKDAVGEKAAPTATAKTYALSSGTITWVGSKKVSGSSHEGTFNVASGVFSAEGTAIKSGEFIIDMKSLKNTDLAESPDKQAGLEGHLKGEDFFEVEKYGQSVFAITAVTESKADGFNYYVSGDLTMKGKTKNISIPVNVTLKEDGTLTASSDKFSIDRMDWGIEYGNGGIKGLAADKVISDNVGMQISCSIVCILKK